MMRVLPLERLPEHAARISNPAGNGFQELKTLNLPKNLQQDWVQKGFPTEKRAAAADGRQD
jgi:hypothetical protein